MRLRSERRARAGVPVLACVLALAGCSSTPPPAPAPTEVVSTPTSEQTPNQIVIGVEQVSGGFNPHNLADVSTTTTALSQLLLPSVFRLNIEGKQRLDKTLMRSAEVVETEPFTVSYVIRPDASWSDGAPIAAEDFGYLAEQMRRQPGTVDPAGYRLITDVESHEGGKRVEVTFAERYPGWRTLFANLLPSHLLKDIPGGWQGAMEGSYPSYGGPFAIKTVDTARGEILVERNERYWEKPSAVDQLVLRRADDDGPAAALRNGSSQFALTSTDAAALAALKRLGKRVELHTVARPYVAEVLLRPAGGDLRPLADDDVRAAVAALVDRGALISAGGQSAARRADAQMLAPSERGYRPTVPADRRAPNPKRAGELLRAAGYTRGTDGWQSPDGEPLRVVIASPGEQEPYASIAAELAEQLTEAGVTASAVQPDARELYAVDPAAEDAEPIDVDGEEVTVDIVVGPRAVSQDPPTALASRFACRSTGSSEGDAEGGEDGSEGGEGEGSEDAGADGTDVEPGNVAGFCDASVQSAVDAVLSGRRGLSGELPELEPRLWQAAVSIPLYQLTDTLAVSKDVAGVTEGPPLAGPFGEAVNWIRTGE